MGHWCSVWDWCTCVGAGTKVRVSFCKELPVLRLAAWEWIYRLYGNIKSIDHKQIAGISDKEKSNSTWEGNQIAPLPFVFSKSTYEMKYKGEILWWRSQSRWKIIGKSSCWKIQHSIKSYLLLPGPASSTCQNLLYAFSREGAWIHTGDYFSFPGFHRSVFAW